MNQEELSWCVNDHNIHTFGRDGYGTKGTTTVVPLPTPDKYQISSTTSKNDVFNTYKLYKNLMCLLFRRKDENAVPLYHTKWNGFDITIFNKEHVAELSYIESDRSNQGRKNEACEVVAKAVNIDMNNMGDTVSPVGFVCPEWRRGNGIQSSTVPAIETIKSWDFDALAFTQPTLINIAELMLDHFEIYEKFSVDRKVMNKFIHDVMINYADVDYHNFHHAIVTMHMTFLFLTLADGQQYLLDCEIYALLIGALTHDVDHKGQNNDYNVKLKTDLAVLYKDESVLENNAITKAHELWNKYEEGEASSSILSGCSDDERQRFEDYFSHVILYTDPSKHGQLTDRLANVVSERVNKGLAFFDASNSSDRSLIGEIIIHASDIGSPSLGDFVVVRDWCQRISMEFKKQALLEKDAKVEVTSYMKGLESEAEVAKSQVEFYKYMIFPLFKMVSLLFPKAALLEKNAKRNFARYSLIAHAVDQSLVC